MHLFGTVAIATGMTAYEDGMRTQFGCGSQRHGGVHAKFASLIRCRGDHTPLVALPADDDGFSLQVGVEQFFHGHEESIHIDVEDGPRKSTHGEHRMTRLDFTKTLSS